jgi:thiol-disulfide isomerase/thioredoxin
MGRLPLVICLFALGCEEKKAPTSGQGRSEAVAASTTTSVPVASSAPAPHPTSNEKRVLCSTEARAFPKAPQVKVVDASGTQTTATIDLKGNFTWVNFWAAWCGPCKEEMPRLRAWKSKIVAQGIKFELALISLDDDERQLERELASQAEKKSLWLPDGPMRTAVLGPLKMKATTNLPVHALIDPEGKVRCFIDGAVEDKDYDEVVKLLR